MLTELQEKILKKLIDNLPLSASQSINLSDFDNGALACGAVKSLHNMGYVIDTSTLSGAEAILTDKGSNYFMEKEKQKYGEATMNEIELINKDIEYASKILATHDQKNIDDEVKRLSNIYMDIAEGLSIYPRQTRVKNIYDSNSDGGFKQPDQISNLKIIIERLIHRKADILSKAEAQRTKSGGIYIENNPVFNNNNSVIVNISILTVYEAIEKSAMLSYDEKEELKDKLAGIEAVIKTGKTDKSKAWDKIKGVLSWIANKAVDVGLAVTLIPYLAEILKGLAL